MTTVQLDDLDRQLIEVLARDARVSNRKIASTWALPKAPSAAGSSGYSRTG